MNDDFSDDDLRRAWRAASRETTPAGLDRRILERARRADTTGPLRGGWTRPLAFAATLTLGVALLLDMQSVEQRPSTAFPRQERQAESVDSAAGNVAAPRSEAVPREDADLLAPSSAVERAPAARDDSRTLSEFSRFGDNALERLENTREQAESESRKLKAGQPRARLAVDEPARGLPGGEACRGEFRASADAWWGCIRALADAGEDALAQGEQEAFELKFPDYRIPD